MTTYDELYEVFIVNCRGEGSSMPITTEQIYNNIKNAVLLFNNRFRDNLQCNDDAETFSRKLSGDELLVIAHFIRLTVLKNNRTYKNSIFTTFTKEIGVRNIGAQLNSLKDEIEAEERTIKQLIFNMTDESIM